MNRRIAIYGAGGFGRETAWMIRQINLVKSTWSLIGFYDDGVKAGIEIDGLQVLGGIDTLNNETAPLAVSVAIAMPQVRESLVRRITNSFVDFPVLVHPMSLAGDPARTEIGKGCILTAGAVLTTGISIGDFTIVNLGVTIGHDVKIGRCVTLMPGCSLSGNVTIEDSVMIGTGARLLQGITVGEKSQIGAGAVVTKSISKCKTAVGVPARER